MSVNREVAIITRTKNRPVYLVRCIESVLSQDFEDWIHIIVNDGGDAAKVAAISERYAERYNSRLILLHHEKSLGMEAASNAGLRVSQSTFVTFLDDDDTWDSQFLSQMLAHLKQISDGQVRGVVCQTERIYEGIVDEKIVAIKRVPYNPELRSVGLYDLLIVNLFTNNSFLFRRSVLDDIGHYNEGLPALGDWDFNVRFLLRFEIIVLEKMLARWHVRETGVGASEMSSLHLRNLWYLRLQNEAIRSRWLDGKPHLALIHVFGGRLNSLERKFERDIKGLEEKFERDTKDLRSVIRHYSFVWQMRRLVTTLLKRLFKRV